ncbi:MAG: hypothetical protein NT042_14425 [Sulfuritalea sp.]|nr:hypothetical protein [Sulfuritalea sp.]
MRLLLLEIRVETIKHSTRRSKLFVIVERGDDCVALNAQMAGAAAGRPVGPKGALTDWLRR